MNYEKTVCDMLEHADNEGKPEEFTNLLRSLSFGISQCSANARTLELQDEVLNYTFDAIRKEARATFLQVNGLSPEELLKHAVTVGPMQ